MNSKNPRRLFLVFGIIIILLGILMIVSHIKNGAYLILLGIVVLGFTLIPRIISSMIDSSSESRYLYYPNINQSILITGINLLMAILIVIKVKPSLDLYIGKEASNLISEVLIVGIPLFIALLIRKRKTSYISFNWRIENIRIIPFIVFGSVALLFGFADPIGNLFPMSDSLKKSLMDFGSQTGIFAFLLLVIAAPILEELLFRGIILDGLLKTYSPVISILVSSLLFGIAHILPGSIINGFIIGIFSGWVYFRTRSVLPSIIIHASANLSGFLIRFLVDIDTQLNDSLVTIYGGVTNLILFIIGSIIVFSICIYLLTKEFNKRTEQIFAPMP